MIEIMHLSKSFKGFKAVDDISFSVPDGERFAFLGPNGAGKTTTIKMLTTLMHPDSGQISIAGFDVVHDQHNVRKSFGIVFQDPSLDDELTAYENMELHAVLYDVHDPHDKIIDLLRFVELADRKDDEVKKFSGGMKRRLEIARSLLHHPKVIFLDEPTVGLDPQTRNHMWEYIMDLNKKEKLTIFFTTHYMEEAEKYAERIAVIDHGKIIAIGTSNELKKKTKTKTLEDAFLKLTGRTIRDEEASSLDFMRQRRRVMHR